MANDTNRIKSAADYAAGLMDAGVEFHVAVRKAITHYHLDQNDPIRYSAVFREIASELSRRGVAKKKAQAAQNQIAKTQKKQLDLALPPGPRIK